jgi:plastocyanin
MHYTTIASGALLSAAVVSATTINVKAGASGLTFTPNNLTAAVGDNVQFTFYPANHNVVQASFANPCMPMNGGFYSGFMPTSSGPANKTFTITVNDTTPIWFYCGQGTHCESGMVGVINQAYAHPIISMGTKRYTDMKIVQLATRPSRPLLKQPRAFQRARTPRRSRVVFCRPSRLPLSLRLAPVRLLLRRARALPQPLAIALRLLDSPL